MAAWDPAAGWEDELVPFEAMPCSLDPETGWVASANGKPTVDGDGPFLGNDYIDGYRIARIVEVLSGQQGWDVAACQRLQMDVTAVPWRELRDMVLGLGVDAAAEPDAARGLEILAAWDGRIAADSAGASVYEGFAAELTARLAREKAPGSWAWAIGAGFGQVVPRTLFATRAMSRLVRLLRERPAAWFATGSWEDAAIAALGDTVRTLVAEHGDDPEAWGWGQLRQVTLEHPIGVRRPLDRLFNIGPFAMGGDANTPMQVSSGPVDPFGRPGALANTRCVMDLGDPSASRFSLAGGQSGNPLSPHYRDLFELWLGGEGAPMAWSEAEVAAATVATLVLHPAPVPD
jgi:penicillin G amidase